MQKAQITLTPEDLTTAIEAAKHLGVHFTTVYRWLKKGKLHPIRIAGQDYLSISEVEQLKSEIEKAGITTG